jgi:hypothetical protein
MTYIILDLIIVIGEVHLSLNRLTGTLPNTISRLTKLYYFSVRFNQITGTLPSVFGDLADLRQFSVYTNKMVGTIPPELGKLRNLGMLIIHILIHKLSHSVDSLGRHIIPILSHSVIQLFTYSVVFTS